MTLGGAELPLLKPVDPSSYGFFSVLISVVGCASFSALCRSRI